MSLLHWLLVTGYWLLVNLTVSADTMDVRFSAISITPVLREYRVGIIPNYKQKSRKKRIKKIYRGGRRERRDIIFNHGFHR